MKFELNTMIKLSADVICRANQDGTVIVMKMNDDQFFYKIDGVAAEMWLKMTENNFASLLSLIEKSSVDYNVATDKILQDSQVFLNKALELNLIKIETL